MTEQNNKGFSLLELLVVIAIMGIVSVMVFTGGDTRKAKQIESDLDNVVDYLNLYKNKALGSGLPQFLYVQSTNVNDTIDTSITPYEFNTPVYGAQTTCNICCGTYAESTTLKNFTSTASEIKLCTNGACVSAAPASGLGICYYTDGSLGTTTGGDTFLIQGAWNGNQNVAAYKIVTQSVTSFLEKFKCKSASLILAGPEYCDVNDTGAWDDYE